MKYHAALALMVLLVQWTHGDLVIYGAEYRCSLAPDLNITLNSSRWKSWSDQCNSDCIHISALLCVALVCESSVKNVMLVAANWFFQLNPNGMK